MGKIKQWIGLSFLGLLLGCAGPYNAKDNNKTIELTEDDSFEVVLVGAVNSDFSWQMASQSNLVELQSPVQKIQKGDKIEYTFLFGTRAAGEGDLILVYTDGQATEETFRLHVIVGLMGEILSD